MPLLLTTSWDDGHPLDLRVAELLARHGLPGTFFCPQHNGEGRSVLTGAQLRQLALAGFEIGSHTHDHVYADRVPAPLWQAQVQRGKAALEDQLGQAVAGFCYPGGVFGTVERTIVRQAGFDYARSTVNLCGDAGRDRFALPTTLQLYPHAPSVLWRNLLRHGRWRARWPQLRACLPHRATPDRVTALLEQLLQHGGVLHLWGHAWEIEQLGAWVELDRLFALLAARVPAADRLNTAALVRRLHPSGGPA